MGLKQGSIGKLKNSDPFVVKYIVFDTTRLVDNNGKFYDSIKVFEAQKIARDAGLDLVCFNSPQEKDLAFCKIIDFNKWKYECEKKKKKEEKQHRRHNKEMRFTPGIEENDIAHKMRQVNGFLDEGDDVILVMKLRGRERIHFKDAEEKMNCIVAMSAGHGKEMSRKKTGDLIIIRLNKIGKTEENIIPNTSDVGK